MKDFTELKDYPNYYIAHSPARLLREVNGIYIECSQTPNSKQDNYWIVTVKDLQGKHVKRSMHRLLMQTFVPNPEAKAHVNHIDGNKANNELSNLEWATPKENAQHAYATGLSSAEATSKEVHQYFLNGEYIASYPSDHEAMRQTGIPQQNIGKAILGKRIHAGYFRWVREKVNSLKPIDRRYIKGYWLNDNYYNNLKEISDSLGLSGGKTASIARFSKSIRNNIIKDFYK